MVERSKATVCKTVQSWVRIPLRARMSKLFMKLSKFGIFIVSLLTINGFVALVGRKVQTVNLVSENSTAGSNPAEVALN